ncbi:universal stress protein [Microbacterium sp.]|uniref:universal stress protein n=1 Tax=Microbacterium sp. TaxID=51671 RepID=UPI0039E44FB4
MTILVGCRADESGIAALSLAALLARSADTDLVVCAVVSDAWPVDPTNLDTEFLAYLERVAQQHLDQARARLPEDVRATFIARHARSVPKGLMDAADEYDADMIVVGSSSSAAHGRLSLGATAERIAHGSERPVAMAPRGFRAGAHATVRRVTVAYGGTTGGDQLVRAAARVAGRVGAALRLAAFAVRPTTLFADAVVAGKDDLVVEQWVRRTTDAIQTELDEVRHLPEVPSRIDAVLGQGYSWPEAIDDAGWAEGDVLVIGSSRGGPVARVFLGSRSSKILRNAPVPVVVVPGAAAEALAGDD